MPKQDYRVVNGKSSENDYMRDLQEKAAKKLVHDQRLAGGQHPESIDANNPSAPPAAQQEALYAQTQVGEYFEQGGPNGQGAVLVNRADLDRGLIDMNDVKPQNNSKVNPVDDVAAGGRGAASLDATAHKDMGAIKENVTAPTVDIAPPQAAPVPAAEAQTGEDPVVSDETKDDDKGDGKSVTSPNAHSAPNPASQPENSQAQ